MVGVIIMKELKIARVIISGSRKFNDYPTLEKTVDDILSTIKDDYIIEKFAKSLKKCRVGEVVKTIYRCTKKGERYLIEHGYLE